MTGAASASAAPRGYHQSTPFADHAAWLAGWIAPLLFLYLLVIFPLLFPTPELSVAERELGDLVKVNSAEHTSFAKQIAYLILFALASAGALLTTAYRRIPWTDPGVLLALAMSALALASVIWSAAPDVSLMRALLLLINTLAMVLSVYAASEPSRIVPRMFWVLFLATILSAVALVVRPPTEIGHAGFSIHKNGFGLLATFILYFGIYRLVTGSPLERAAAAVMIVAAPIFLVASQSKTSLGLAVIAPAVATLVWLAARYLRLSIAVSGLVAVITLWFVFEIGKGMGVWDLATINQATFGNPTLTGRTEFWDFAAHLISEKPALGWGYEGVFSTGADGVSQRRAIGIVKATPHAHNGYVDITVQLGAAGLAIALLFMLRYLHVFGRIAVDRPALGWLMATLGVFSMFYNCLESSIFTSKDVLSILIITLYVLALRLTHGERVK